MPRAIYGSFHTSLSHSLWYRICRALQSSDSFAPKKCCERRSTWDVLSASDHCSPITGYLTNSSESRVDITFKKIPHEVLEKKAVEQGDIKFFELGALSVEPKQRGREITLMLTDFVIPLDDVPVEARKAIKHWSQVIDYWAVDWDFRKTRFITNGNPIEHGRTRIRVDG